MMKTTTIIRCNLSRTVRRYLSNDRSITDHQQKLMRDALPSNKIRINGARHVLCVASGKGGVGKSSVAVGVAIAMANAGRKTGLLDVDIHGPSLTRMLSLPPAKMCNEKDPKSPAKFLPHEVSPVLYCMSIGMLTGSSNTRQQDARSKSPIAWRGPMLISAVRTLLFNVKWPDIDYLILDLPPGTGDVHLSVLQQIIVKSVVLVTTPHHVALDELNQCGQLFKMMRVPTAAIVVNMSEYVCPNCHQSSSMGSLLHTNEIEMTSRMFGTNCILRLPYDVELARKLDNGCLDEATRDQLAERFLPVASVLK